MVSRSMRKQFSVEPSKFVAAIGIRDLVVVETPDALLICPRDRAKCRKIVKRLEDQHARACSSSPIWLLANCSHRVYSPQMSSIKFGTDGWRGVIAEDFTFANARTVAQGIARYVVRCEDARKGSSSATTIASPRTRSPLLPRSGVATGTPVF